MSGAEDRTAAALAAIERLVASESEADAVLRRTIDTLIDQVPGYVYAGLSFVEDGMLALGPWRGVEPAGQKACTRLAVPVIFEGSRVGELRIAVEEPDTITGADRELLERVAQLLSAHCLVGWDTGGAPWSDVR